MSDNTPNKAAAILRGISTPLTAPQAVQELLEARTQRDALAAALEACQVHTASAVCAIEDGDLFSATEELRAIKAEIDAALAAAKPQADKD